MWQTVSNEDSSNDLSAIPQPSRRYRRKAPLARRARRVIEETVSQVFGVGQSDLGTANRGRAPIAEARQVAMYLAHVVLRITMTDVGALFARDRTTVAHACGVIEDRRDDPTFDRVLELLEWAVVALLVPHRFRLTQQA